ncbi:hypothetical protein L6164_036612 [Bauhinia variegata]|uniref:Uncharacterized protein n=1 Tax=Bauhinia variegata TaxID=167791 RepID=A0ACB9KHL0_BAUVA|nr:hypothetical protein L6164_036612 [Bauhinia variegata]
MNPPITLQFEDVVHQIKIDKGKGLFCNKESAEKKLVLKGVSGTILPGELLAILGPSGSGKTTLLSALGGQLNRPTSGIITYNGKAYSRSVKANMGFVPQKDVFYPHLTVNETLVFTALLRLPNSLSKEEKVLHAQEIMNQLQLTHCMDTIMGGPLLKGISGGEWKRVSIGQELLKNPSLLLVDEPTSGLDSSTARKIVLTLCELAQCGRTVVMTIHQPSSKLFYMFQKVLLLSDGKSLYFGKGECAMNYFSSIGFVPSIAMDPSDFLLDLANGISSGGTDEDREAIKQALVSAYESNLSHQEKMELQNYRLQCHDSSEDEKFGEWCTTWWQQVTVLLKRGLKERKYESFSVLRICQVVTSSLLVGALWWQVRPDHIRDRVALLFFYIQFCGYIPLVQTIFTFNRERAVLIKERSACMYRLSSYFIASNVVDLPMQLALPALFVTMTYWMGGLNADATSFFIALAILLLYALVAQGLGLAIGALVNNQRAAAIVGKVVMTLFILISGFYVQSVPVFLSWIKCLSLSYYSFKLLLGSQFKDDDSYPCGSNATCLAVNFPAIKNVGLDRQGFSIAALALMLVGYRLIAYFALMSGLKQK